MTSVCRLHKRHSNTYARVGRLYIRLLGTLTYTAHNTRDAGRRTGRGTCSTTLLGSHVFCQTPKRGEKEEGGFRLFRWLARG